MEHSSARQSLASVRCAGAPLEAPGGGGGGGRGGGGLGIWRGGNAAESTCVHGLFFWPGQLEEHSVNS